MDYLSYNKTSQEGGSEAHGRSLISIAFYIINYLLEYVDVFIINNEASTEKNKRKK